MKVLVNHESFTVIIFQTSFLLCPSAHEIAEESLSYPNSSSTCITFSFTTCIHEQDDFESITFVSLPY